MPAKGEGVQSATHKAAALWPELMGTQHGHNYIKFILPFPSNSFRGTRVKGRAPNQGIKGAVPKNLLHLSYTEIKTIVHKGLESRVPDK